MKGDEEIIQRGRVALGDSARLRNVFLRARAGERLVIGALGGSITAGASASSEQNRWANRVCEWWRTTFPKATFEFVNAGIGATGSDIGAHRVGRHLMSRHPDFVAIEYAVNDGGSPLAGETLEGVVRQILRASNSPAALLLFTMNNQGINVQEAHIPVGQHYGLPMVSFRDALWPEIQAGRMQWNDIEADEVHPNDKGHEWCARLIESALERILAEVDAGEKGSSPIPDLPHPLISDLFEQATFLNAEEIVPIQNQGWSVTPGSPMGWGPGWSATEPGSSLEFEVEGRAISLIFYRIKGPMGIAEAKIDDRAPVRMDAWFDADWGGYSPFQLVARDLEPGRHRLRIELAKESNPGSQGHEFRVEAVLTAGRRP